MTQQIPKVNIAFMIYHLLGTVEIPCVVTNKSRVVMVSFCSADVICMQMTLIKVLIDL